MPKDIDQKVQRPPDFFDVFISYRHRDEDKIEELDKKIQSYGFQPFHDLKYSRFADTRDVTRNKIQEIRQILSRATCLIFAYSRTSTEEAKNEEAKNKVEPGAAVGAWMPWELGFFDGSISARIGVYLLDGEPDHFDPKKYFKGSEYLQIYPALVDKKTKTYPHDRDGMPRIMALEDFLNDFAVKERRIDNVASAFVWFEHLFEECLANPTNVGLGVLEWYVDHTAHFFRENGVEPWGAMLYNFKDWLDTSRLTWVRRLRWPFVDALLKSAHAQERPMTTTVAAVAKMATAAAVAGGFPAPEPSAKPDNVWARASDKTVAKSPTTAAAPVIGEFWMPARVASTTLSLMNPWLVLDAMDTTAQRVGAMRMAGVRRTEDAATHV